MSNMKLTFNFSRKLKTFHHSRTNTAIRVEHIKPGASVITMIDDENNTASFEVSDSHHLSQLSNLITHNKSIHQANGNISLLASKTSFGEPFEQCAELCMMYMDPNDTSNEHHLYAYLSSDDYKPFLSYVQENHNYQIG